MFMLYLIRFLEGWSCATKFNLFKNCVALSLEDLGGSMEKPGWHEYSPTDFDFSSSSASARSKDISLVHVVSLSVTESVSRFSPRQQWHYRINHTSIYNNNNISDRFQFISIKSVQSVDSLAEAVRLCIVLLCTVKVKIRQPPVGRNRRHLTRNNYSISG